MLLKDAINEFERGLIGQGYSKNSVATYMRHLTKLSEQFGDKEIEEIRRADLTDFLFNVRLKAAPRNSEFCATGSSTVQLTEPETFG